MALRGFVVEVTCPGLFNAALVAAGFVPSEPVIDIVRPVTRRSPVHPLPPPLTETLVGESCA
jgi:hypothetical protein